MNEVEIYADNYNHEFISNRGKTIVGGFQMHEKYVLMRFSRPMC